MQGFYQVASFQIAREPVADEQGDSVEVEYIVVSRRSRDRAGLRYQRRGIDEDSNVANFVETETVMRVEVSHFIYSKFTNALTAISARRLLERV